MTYLNISARLKAYHLHGLKIVADYFGVSGSYLLSDNQNHLNYEKEQTLAELQVLRDDADFRDLMDAYKKLTPEKVRIMKRFMKSLNEEDDNIAN